MSKYKVGDIVKVYNINRGVMYSNGLVGMDECELLNRNRFFIKEVGKSKKAYMLDRMPEDFNDYGRALKYWIPEDVLIPCVTSIKSEDDESINNGGSTPKQYALPKDAGELQDLINYRNMNFSVGNIFKACYRLGIKNDDIYDLNKIIFFAKAEIDRIKKYGK